MKAWVDGVLVLTGSTSGSWAATFGGSAYVGWSSNGGEYMRGGIQRLRIWDGLATGSDIVQMYNNLVRDKSNV